jgi:hypothetical protein
LFFSFFSDLSFSPENKKTSPAKMHLPEDEKSRVTTSVHRSLTVIGLLGYPSIPDLCYGRTRHRSNRSFGPFFGQLRSVSSIRVSMPLAATGNFLNGQIAIYFVSVNAIVSQFTALKKAVKYTK